MKERLQKILAGAGVCSRREAERLILVGEVEVNGETVLRLGTKADPEADRISVRGRRLSHRRPRIYLALHKPRGYVTTLKDPEGRKTVLDLMEGLKERLYPAGRLDYNAEGLLIMTNDGDLAFALMRPGHVPKTYRVKVKGTPSPEALERLRHGLVLEGRKLLPVRARLLGRGESAWLLLTLLEGRQNQIVRMMDAIGHPVRRLRRVSIGPVGLGALPGGHWRPLESEEIHSLRRAAGVETGRRGAEDDQGRRPYAERRARAGRRPSTPTGGGRRTAARRQV